MPGGGASAAGIWRGVEDVLGGGAAVTAAGEPEGGVSLAEVVGGGKDVPGGGADAAA